MDMSMHATSTPGGSVSSNGRAHAVMTTTGSAFDSETTVSGGVSAAVSGSRSTTPSPIRGPKTSATLAKANTARSVEPRTNAATRRTRRRRAVRRRESRHARPAVAPSTSAMPGVRPQLREGCALPDER